MASVPDPAKQNRDHKGADELDTNLKSGKENCVRAYFDFFDLRPGGFVFADLAWGPWSDLL